MKKFTEEEIELIKQRLSEKISHENIGLELGRTKSSIMHKIQRLGLAKPCNDWKHLTKDNVLQLIKTHISAESFDARGSGLPSHKILMRILGVASWSEARKLAGIPVYSTAKWDKTKETIFYIIQVIDTDGTEFRKFGVTQRSIKIRYGGFKDYLVILNKTMPHSQALRIEKLFSKITIKYKPKDTRFSNQNQLGGHTECYIGY